MTGSSGSSGGPTASVDDILLNADIDWDYFDSQDYFQHNYGRLRHDDAEIINIVANFFASQRWKTLGRAIDVGTGTNLYPAMIMLPYAAELILFERAFSNRDWLTATLRKPQDSWQVFWHTIARGRKAYERFRKPLDVLLRTAKVVKGNVYELERAQYDLGTMFFVAESITSREREFRLATQKFVNSLVPGAPFAAAFMCRSDGYTVGGQHFPAYSIGPSDVESCLASVARIRHIDKVDSHDLREGYSGMIVATGWRKLQ
ncbi:SCO2525 family SAM-dependent methyltransferase [Paractinoplanes brasiliensis]|uniref:NNMT/PNMT/TEMT family protein n=1 Tax=Paractinoplanes brasiliensis TaxID=52695 RepID=A0A4R6K035_9ACTN|nr:SCO2525 family SAM-dependent methyltransferase [Actinoplanes brasiliensis]TDO42543.1 hypothetical protein C8E87_6316 [Actinoplanes brasiliensis]GID31353.1 hypothetical protein Abr02nite_63360 [Actinoplanes brasiliensis]